MTKIFGTHPDRIEMGPEWQEASMNEFLFGTQRKVYCRKCGKKLIDKEVIIGYNEFDGTPTKLIIEGVCPDQDDHLKLGRYKKAKKILGDYLQFGEDLND